MQIRHHCLQCTMGFLCVELSSSRLLDLSHSTCIDLQTAGVCKIKSIYLSTVKHCYKTSVLNRERPVRTNRCLILILNLHSFYFLGDFYDVLMSQAQHFSSPQTSLMSEMHYHRTHKQKVLHITATLLFVRFFFVCFSLFFLFFFNSTQKSHCSNKQISKISFFFHCSDLLQNS